MKENVAKSGFPQRAIDGKDEWLTPRSITDALGPFDLDPCSPIDRPWPTAKKHLTINDDGLWGDWEGFVWCNPPYGNHTGDWLEKLAEHGNGIALVFARTETEMFQKYIWNMASSLLFIYGRIKFFHVDGTEAENYGGAPSVLVGYGDEADKRLANIDPQTLTGCLLKTHNPRSYSK